jgi:nucleoside-diphosphate-sugar epimerase
VLGWVPQTSLERGIEITYRWVREQLEARNETGSS